MTSDTEEAVARLRRHAVEAYGDMEDDLLFAIEALSASQAEVERLTRERDEARELARSRGVTVLKLTEDGGAHLCRAEAARLRELSAGWQTIDSAPRDGRSILAAGGGLGCAVDVVSYSPSVGCWNCSAVTLDDVDDEPDGYSRPAHWRPIPPPPGDAG